MFHTRFRRAPTLSLFLAMALSVAPVSVSAANEPATRLTFADLAACPLVLPSTANEASWRSVLSPRVQDALGRRVRITGYLLPLAEGGGPASRQLWLMRSQDVCCGRHPPPPGEHVVVKTSTGLAQAPGPVRLEGTLRIAPVVVAGSLVSFFQLDDAKIAAP